MKGSLKVITALVGATLALVQPAFSQGKDAAYSCIEEMSAGLAFDETTNKWASVRFRPDHKFVIRMQFIKDVVGLRLSDYNVTITEAGKDDAVPCTDRLHFGEPARVENDKFRCRAKFTDFIVNVRTLRFLTDFPEGYVDGRDTNEDTPSVSGGTCTKID